MKNLYAVALTILLSCYTTLAIGQTTLQCGVNDQNLPDSTIRLMSQLPRLMADQHARKAAGDRNTCRIAVEIDSDTYLEFDKDTNRIRSFFLNRIEQVSKIYEREINTQLVVVFFHIWKDTEPDPYRNQLDIYKLYSIFSTTWTGKFNQIPYDKRVYIPTKTVTGAGGLGGGEQAVCANLVDVSTIAHELGHCFGSPHTHSCSWPGGPIDYCFNIENGSCYNKSLQTIKGTIMSYCSNRSDLTFHPLCQVLITNYAVKSLAKLIMPDKVPVLPARVTLSGLPFLYWNGHSMAERYDVEVATDAGFTQKVIGDTTQVNGYDMGKLTAGQDYYVRVRAVNRLGTSGWSAASVLRIGAPDEILPPKLIYPAKDQLRIPYNQGKQLFTVQPVSGATQYEIQVTNSSDFLFRSPTKATSTPASFSMALPSTGVKFWRVRALVNNKTGPWSDVGRFTINTNRTSLTLPFFSSEATLSFPYHCFASINGSIVRVTLATDTTFSKPVMTQTFQDEDSYAGMLDKLSPNTTYYLQMEEINNQVNDYPAGTMTKDVQSFRTGNTVLSSRWAFINSATYPAIAQGYTSGSLQLTADVAWYMAGNGLIRISQDSLTLRVYNQANTNGTIGNSRAYLSSDASGNVWLMNRISVNIFNNGNAFPTPYFQMGRITERMSELTNRTTYYNNNSIYSFSVNPHLIYSPNGIYEQKADSVAKFYTPPANRSISSMLVQSGIIWMIQYNSSSSTAPYELVQLNIITGITQVFNADNTPQLGKYLLAMAIDGLGSIWVAQAGSTAGMPPLAKFNGQTWITISRSSTVPISFVNAMAIDPSGNLYVLDGSATRSIYKYDGIIWKKLTDVPFTNTLGSMNADAKGNIWFNGSYQLIRYASCADQPAPTLTVTKQTINAGESSTLQAAGCSSVLWSWSSETENVSDKLVQGTNKLVVQPTVNTTYRSRCYDGGCTGAETSLTLTVAPTLSLIKLNKSAFCQNDSLTATYTLQGKVAATNQFSFIIKSNKQTTSFPAKVRANQLVMQLPATQPASNYWVYIEANSPVARARDSIRIAVLDLPTAELSTNKPTFAIGDSARISIALTGTPPWQFTRWDRQVIRAANSPYVYSLKATQPTNYSLSITTLNDANCANGTVKNSIVVSALALANEPIISEDISVYPNPVVGQLVIEVNPSAAPLFLLRLQDEQGREVRRKLPANRSHREEWEVSTLPNGAYILRIETQDGRVVNWKVIKQ